MLVYGILNAMTEEVFICTISDLGLDGLTQRLSNTCHEAEFPFLYSLGSNELRWWCPADECYDDYDELYYFDDDCDEHFLKDEYYLNDSYYRQLIISAYDAFTERLRGVLPYLR